MSPDQPLFSVTDAPAALGYRMPAEWAPQQAMWFSWPQNPDTWPADKLAGCEATLAQAVQALRTGQTVHLNVLDADHEAHVRAVIDAAPVPVDLPVRFPVVYHRIPTNDAWCRDHGAIFVTNPDADAPLVATVWGFNAWGGKYPPFDLDDAVADQMAAALGVPAVDGGMILEGGSIEVNSQGVLLTTESCLLSTTRNPGLSRAEIEQRIKYHLGVHTIYWLGGELVGDDTDGHIDNLARFVNDTTIVAIATHDSADVHYASLQGNLDTLRALRQPDGTPYTVVELPMPAPVVVDGVQLPASYANFLIGNTVVLLPVYGDPNDAVATEILQQYFPDRTVVGLNCRDVIWGLGAFHCLSQQVPAAGG